MCRCGFRFRASAHACSHRTSRAGSRVPTGRTSSNLRTPGARTVAGDPLSARFPARSAGSAQRQSCKGRSVPAGGGGRREQQRVKEQAPGKNLMNDSIMFLPRFVSVCYKSASIGVGNRREIKKPHLCGWGFQHLRRAFRGFRHPAKEAKCGLWPTSCRPYRPCRPCHRRPSALPSSEVRQPWLRW